MYARRQQLLCYTDMQFVSFGLSNISVQRIFLKDFAAKQVQAVQALIITILSSKPYDFCQQLVIINYVNVKDIIHNLQMSDKVHFPSEYVNKQNVSVLGNKQPSRNVRNPFSLYSIGNTACAKPQISDVALTSFLNINQELNTV